MSKMTTVVRVEDISDIIGFIEEQLDEIGCPMKAQMQLSIAADEILANIANYAYAPDVGEATIEIEEENGYIKLGFSDGGKPFNPLEIPEPDVTQDADSRKVGGLGIFMVKKSMDKMEYEYSDGKNILKLYKKL